MGLDTPYLLRGMKGVGSFIEMHIQNLLDGQMTRNCLQRRFSGCWERQEGTIIELINSTMYTLHVSCNKCDNRFHHIVGKISRWLGEDVVVISTVTQEDHVHYNIMN